MSRWAIQIQQRRGYWKAVVAVAAKNARMGSECLDDIWNCGRHVLQAIAASQNDQNLIREFNSSLAPFSGPDPQHDLSLRGVPSGLLVSKLMVAVRRTRITVSANFLCTSQLQMVNFRLCWPHTDFNVVA